MTSFTAIVVVIIEKFERAQGDSRWILRQLACYWILPALVLASCAHFSSTSTSILICFRVTLKMDTVETTQGVGLSSGIAYRIPQKYQHTRKDDYRSKLQETYKVKLGF
jgi:hypothetical protein